MILKPTSHTKVYMYRGFRIRLNDGDDFIKKQLVFNELVDKSIYLIEKLMNIKNYHPNMFKYIMRLKENFSKCSLIQETPINSDNITSYTINKGDIISLCVYDKNGNLHKNNLLTYVLLHELAHIACPSEGHGKEFIYIFKFITDIAAKNNIYRVENYKKYPINYCGMELNTSICF